MENTSHLANDAECSLLGSGSVVIFIYDLIVALGMKQNGISDFEV